MTKILYEAEADLAIVQSRTVAIIGYGNQGRAHAANLADNGVRVIIGAREKSAAAPREDGREVATIAEATKRADLVMILTPDETHAAIFEREVAPNLEARHALAFGHGFSIHYGRVRPRDDIDVVLVAPVGPGHLLRTRFEEGSGIPCAIAVHRDASGCARALALSYAGALGCGRAGIFETTFRDETETDLFGEQAVICGGVTALIRAGFETLVEAGYPEELAYFECCHQMKLLVDLIHEHGIAGMRRAISNTAKYGDLTRGSRIIDAGAKERMREVLGEIQSGAFAREWVAEVDAGRPKLDALLAAADAHPIERVGERLRRPRAK